MKSEILSDLLNITLFIWYSHIKLTILIIEPNVLEDRHYIFTLSCFHGKVFPPSFEDLRSNGEMVEMLAQGGLRFLAPSLISNPGQDLGCRP